jgi:hypothetical protein
MNWDGGSEESNVFFLQFSPFCMKFTCRPSAETISETDLMHGGVKDPWCRPKFGSRRRPMPRHIQFGSRKSLSKTTALETMALCHVRTELTGMVLCFRT